MVRYMLFSAAVLIPAIALYFFHVRLTAEDIPFYHKLILESADLRAHSALEKSSVLQMRKGVRKDIWTIQKEQWMHCRIESARSDMTLIQKGGRIEAMEVLHEIEGWVESNDETRHMVAESGVCFFPSCQATFHCLVADLKPRNRIDVQEIRFDKASNELLCFFPHGRLGDHETLFDADTGYTHLNRELRPQALFLDGNVRIASSWQKSDAQLAKLSS